jgi:hypothetical protein
MKRREFMTLVGVAAVWPLTARAQPTSKIPRIGLLTSSLLRSPFDSVRQGFADMAVGLGDVRYRGQGGSRILGPGCQLLTQPV